MRIKTHKKSIKKINGKGGVGKKGTKSQIIQDINFLLLYLKLCKYLCLEERQKGMADTRTVIHLCIRYKNKNKIKRIKQGKCRINKIGNGPENKI